MSKQPINEGLPRKPFQLLESAQGSNGLKRLRGVFQNYTETNLNNRIYPKPIWDKHLAEDSDFSTRRKNRLTIGHIEHPEDGVTRMDQAALVVTEVSIATPEEIAASNGKLHEGDIIGTLELLPTPKGQLLEALTAANIPWGVSSRGNGSIIEGRGGPDTVDEDFQLETWDAVFAPSVVRAIPSLLSESVGSRATKMALLEHTWPETPPSTPTPASAPASAAPVTTPPQPPVTTPSVTNQPTTPITERKRMTPTPLSEIRRIKINLAEMASRTTKTMKPSDKAVIFEQLDEMRVNATRLATEDPTLKSLAEEINTNAMKLATRLDEEDADDAPPAGGPPPVADTAATPPPAAPPADDDGDDSAQVVADLESASNLLRDCGTDECNAAADALDALADRVADLDVEELPPDTAVDTMPVESRRIIAGLQRRLRAANTSLQGLGESAQRLLTKHNAMVKSSGNLIEGHSPSDWATAAKEVTAEYHKECLSLGRNYIKLVAPDLYEAHKDELNKFTNYRKFVKFVERIKKASKPVAENRPARPAPSTPSRPVTEGQKTAPNVPSKPPVPVAESHPALAFLDRNRATLRG